MLSDKQDVVQLVKEGGYMAGICIEQDNESFLSKIYKIVPSEPTQLLLLLLFYVPYQNWEKRSLTSCPSVCPHGTTRLPLEEFS